MIDYQLLALGIALWLLGMHLVGTAIVDMIDQPEDNVCWLVKKLNAMRIICMLRLDSRTNFNTKLLKAKYDFAIAALGFLGSIGFKLETI